MSIAMITILETAASESLNQEHAILNHHDNKYLKYDGRVENIFKTYHISQLKPFT